MKQPLLITGPIYPPTLAELERPTMPIGCGARRTRTR